MTNEIHPFEKAGLGKAPFRFVGMAQQDRCYGEVILNRAECDRTGIALTTTPGGTCAYCGQAIMRMFDIESADGKHFHVGCECVNRTGDKKLARSVNQARLAADRAKRADKAAETDRSLQAFIRVNSEKLAALPHPKGWDGKTLLDYAEFMATRSGATGRAKALKTLRAQVGQ